MGFLVKGPGTRANRPRPARPSPSGRTGPPRIDTRGHFFSELPRTGCAAVRAVRVACGGTGAPALAAPEPAPARRPGGTPPAAPAAEAGRRGRREPDGSRRGPRVRG